MKSQVYDLNMDIEKIGICEYQKHLGVSMDNF